MAADEESDSEAILGQTLVEAGVNRDIEIEIEPPDELADDLILHATLHWDAGQRSRFEFPDGPDVPLTQDNRLIRVAFRLFTNDESG